jgi:uncharacterized protein with PIN domain
MAGFKSSGGDLSLAEQAAIADWGDQKFSHIDELETAAVAAGDAYARQLMSEEFTKRAREQAARGEAKCPQCQTVGELRGEEDRELQTRRGMVTIREPKCYCPKCRQIFFPAHANLRD